MEVREAVEVFPATKSATGTRKYRVKIEDYQRFLQERRTVGGDQGTVHIS